MYCAPLLCMGQALSPLLLNSLQLLCSEFISIFPTTSFLSDRAKCSIYSKSQEGCHVAALSKSGLESATHFSDTVPALNSDNFMNIDTFFKNSERRVRMNPELHS